MAHPAETAKKEHERKCPLAAIDRRLDDLHRQWHAAEAAYFDPEGFRVAIQTAIQTLRTVTFILQSNKGLIPNFDAWYAPWQEKMRADPLLRWMVDARNKIEKQGDLEAHSFVRAEIIASYLSPGPRIEIPAELFDVPAKLLQSIPANAVGDHIRKDGVLRIERRWVENSLPDYELLDAVARAYGRISLLVVDAHKQAGLRAPVTTDVDSGSTYPEGAADGRLPCMVGHADARGMEFWLATGTQIQFERQSGPIDIDKGKSTEVMYGIAAADAFLLREGNPVQIVELRPEEHGEKYMMMRGLGHEVARHKVDAVIVISEAWSAPMDRARPYMRAADSPERREYLGATLVSHSDDPVMLHAGIERTDDAVALGETSEHRGGAHFMFAPIYEAWGKPIPEEWLRMERLDAADAVKGDG